MRTLYTLLILLPMIVGLADPAIAQQKHCGTDAMHRELVAKYPDIQIEQDFSNIQPGANKRGPNDVYIIPIVFHIVHNYGSENISDEQIYDAVRILNEDYRKLNADTSNIISAFKPIAADAMIEFRLASKDPQGNCTNGIDRIQSLQTYTGDDDAKFNAWPREYYLNIWVVRSMRDGVAGYAYYPSAVEGLRANIDGVIILHDYIGSIGTGSPGRSRALTHEIGHYLNLPHTWGNTNEPGVACGDDGIFDTPITRGHTNCNLNDDFCNDGIIENVQNYMEYAYCSNMFTAGQVEAMRLALEGTASDRYKLWEEGNLKFTGVYYGPGYCTPKADFYATRSTVCEGESIEFRDASWTGDILGWQWTFENATPSTSSDQNPQVVFNTPGWHNVTLTVTGSGGTSAITKNEMVYVFPSNASYFGTYSEGFTDKTRFEQDYVSLNLDANTDSKWEFNNLTGYTDPNCVALGNYQNLKNDIDELIGPAIDLAGLTGTQYLYFRYSNATRAQSLADMKDSLKVFYSTDCGKTWIRLSTLSGLALANDYFHAESFTPWQQRAWKTHSIALPQAALNSNFRFKFQFKSSAFGNNIYIDDINVANFVGVDDLEQLASSFSAYPNPAQNQLTVQYETTKSTNVVVGMYDMLGQEVLRVDEGNKASGNQTVQLNTSSLSNGVYFVKLQVGTETISKKVVIAK